MAPCFARGVLGKEPKICFNLLQCSIIQYIKGLASHSRTELLLFVFFTALAPSEIHVQHGVASKLLVAPDGSYSIYRRHNHKLASSVVGHTLGTAFVKTR